jgi:hypothetical protein
LRRIITGFVCIRRLTMWRLMCLTQGKSLNGVYLTGQSPLLILDDFGLSGLETIVCRDFLEVVDDRSESRSMS